MHDIVVRYQNATAVHKAVDDEPEPDSLQQLVDEVIAAYELQQWTTLVPALQDALQTAGTEAATIAFRSPKIAGSISGSFGEVNQAAVAYAETRAAEMVGMKWVDGELVPNTDARWTITESTRSWLNDIVSDAFEQGMSPAKLATEIQSSGAFSLSRAQMIARTEISNAAVASQFAVSLAAGATHKRTFLSADHADDDDDICVDAADAGEVPIGYDYGLLQLAPLFHPRCKCSISTYVRKKTGA